MQGHDGFEAWTLRIADVRLLLCGGRSVAVVRIANEAVGCAESIGDLGEIRRERDDSIHSRRNRDAAADFVRDNARVRSGGLRLLRRLRGATRHLWESNGEQECRGGQNLSKTTHLAFPVCRQ